MTDAKREARRLARDVAKHVDRRRMRRRIVLLAAIVAAVIAAILYLRCSKGWGTGKGQGAGPGSVAIAPDAAIRCAIRVAATGITVNGKPATRAEAVAACKPLGTADVVVTGDARAGDWDELRAALDAAGISHGR
jgi:hypothetical protein